MPATSMPDNGEEVYTVSQKPGITPFFDQPVSEDMPTGQVRMIDNGPAKPMAPKRGFAK